MTLFKAGRAGRPACGTQESSAIYRTNPCLYSSVHVSWPRMKASHGSLTVLLSFTTQQGLGSGSAVREAKLFRCSKSSHDSPSALERGEALTHSLQGPLLAFFPSPQDKMALNYHGKHTCLSELVSQSFSLALCLEYLPLQSSLR